jgi:hypothetical protein
MLIGGSSQQWKRGSCLLGSNADVQQLLFIHFTHQFNHCCSTKKKEFDPRLIFFLLAKCAQFMQEANDAIQLVNSYVHGPKELLTHAPAQHWSW